MKDNTIQIEVVPYALPKVILTLNACGVDFSITQIDGELFVCIDETHLTEKVYGLLSKSNQSGELYKNKEQKKLNTVRYQIMQKTWLEGDELKGVVDTSLYVFMYDKKESAEEMIAMLKKQNCGVKSPYSYTYEIVEVEE